MLFKRRKQAGDSPLADAGQVDVVVEAPDGAAELTMVETRPWDGSDERLEQLQAKVNAYLAYALDGQLLSDYPQLRDRPLRFRLDHVHELDQSASEMVKRIAEAIAEQDIEFVAAKLPSD